MGIGVHREHPKLGLYLRGAPLGQASSSRLGPAKRRPGGFDERGVSRSFVVVARIVGHRVGNPLQRGFDDARRHRLACVEAFGAKLHEVVTTFESMALDQRSLGIQDQIDEYVQADPRKQGGYDEFLAFAQNMRQWIEQRPDVVRAILASRGL